MGKEKAIKKLEGKDKGGKEGGEGEGVQSMHLLVESVCLPILKWFPADFQLTGTVNLN